MATILDSLFVELGLDPSKFTRGQREATESFKKSQEELEKRAKSMEKRAQSAGDFFGKLRGQVIALYAAFTAGKGIKEFVQDTISTTANLGRMSRTMDISAQELAAWRGTANAMGGSADDMSSSIYGLTQNLQQFMLTGESNVIPYFRALSISIVDTNGKLKTATQLYLEASEKLQGMDPARATALLTGLGANQSMINFLLQSPAKVRAQLAEQRKFAPSPADIKAAQEYQRQWQAIERAQSAAGRSILTLLAPAIMKVLQLVRQFAEYLATHKAAAVAFFTTLTGVVGALSLAMLRGTGILSLFKFGFVALRFSVVGAYQAIAFLVGTMLPRLLIALGTLTAETFPALSAAFTELGIAILATPVGWILGGIALIAGAGYLLYRNWDSIKKWWHNLWNGMGNDTESAADRIRHTNDDLAGRKYTPSPGQQSLIDRIGISAGAPALLGKPSGSKEQEAWNLAKASEAKYGVPAQVTFAQWALESDRGKRTPAGSNNPFGIKAGRNQAGVSAQTSEFINGQYVRVNANFRKFASLQDAFDAHAKLLATDPRYAAAMAVRNDPGAFADALTGIYASDRLYGAKLRAIMQPHAHLARLAASIHGGSHTVNDNRRTSSAETHIGSVTVVTQATDGPGVAKSLGHAIRQNSFAAQANYGSV